MSLSDNVQTLSAAFSFGILLQAATSAALLCVRGHGSTFFQDHRRLVLATFLAASTLLAQLEFINLMVPAEVPKNCQITIIVSAIFDQLARVSIAGFLLWSVAHVSKTTTEKVLLGALIVVRVVAGGLFAGFVRPQSGTVCVASSSFLPASIAVVGLDYFILGIIFIRIFTLHIWQDLRDVRSSTKREQSKAMVFTTIGYFFWITTSIMKLLGFSSFILVLKTAVPATGLLILISIITLYTGALLLPRADESITPEARSPFVTQQPRNLGGSDESPIATTGYTKNVNLFIVNPSNTPMDSPTITMQNGFRSDEYGYNKYANSSMKALEAEDSPRGINMKNDASFNVSSIAAGLAVPLVYSEFEREPMKVTTRLNAVDRRGLRHAQTFPLPQEPEKKARFGRSKTSSKSTVKKLGISQPMMTDAAGPTSFSKIQTVDLATAVAKQRERRDMVSRRELVAHRPAPPPPNEGLRNGTSIKRKQPPLPPLPPPSRSGSSNDGLSVMGNATSTSASLSPGREDVRRRSPRNSKNFEDDGVKRSYSPPKQFARGLPSNPRQPFRPENMQQQTQTVMFIKDIVYNQPGVVKSIISGVPYYSTIKEGSESPKSATSGSMIHRPRPYAKGERAMFPSAPSPGHRRTKSGSSISSRTRTSMFLSRPGSPSNLPPLPLPPTSARFLTKLLYKDTKSMTTEEKIELLFPAPPGVQPLATRRSSVPSIPRVPSTLFNAESTKKFSADDTHHIRTSKQSSNASFDSVLLVPRRNDSPHLNILPSESDTYQFSATDYVAELPSSSHWTPQNFGDGNKTQMSAGISRDSKHVSPRKSTISEESHDNSTTWESLHSPIPAVNLARDQKIARETYIPIRKEQNLIAGPPAAFPIIFVKEEDTVAASYDDDDFDTEWIDATVDSNLSDYHRASSYSRQQSVLIESPPPSPPEKYPWHKRIGDDLLAFSERRKQAETRRMPPPTPLLLGSTGRQASVVVRAPPSVVIDSPTRAIQQIQDQLKKFEQPDRESVGTMLSRLPNAAGMIGNNVVDERTGLLENLEKEMAGQENLWMQMQHNFDRDSNLTMTPAPQDDNSRSVSPGSSRDSISTSRAPSRTVSRRARVRSNISRASGLSTNSTQSSESSRASAWQQRLAQAQMEYVEHAPELLGSRAMNFLSIAKLQLGSPTPPESEGSASDSGSDAATDSEDSGVEVPLRFVTRTASPMKQSTLWTSQLGTKSNVPGGMWTCNKVVADRTPSPEPAALSVRPAQRIIKQPLFIASLSLWTPTTVTNARAPTGLWGSKTKRPDPIVTRPITQRPPRRSRRATLLPDIVESPVPLPDKRDTLGIFRFPWGEKSDTAVYEPPYMPRVGLQGSTSLNSGFEARSRELEPELSEYSSSFFDDYDDEEESDASDIDESSDDDFDETTLWEIATLLKSSDVPSRESIMGNGAMIIEDYDDEDSSEETENAQPVPKAPVVRFMPIQPLARTIATSPLISPSPSKLTSSTSVTPLWVMRAQEPTTVCQIGLIQPVDHIWQSYAKNKTAGGVSRPKIRIQRSIPALESRDLWVAPVAFPTEKVWLHAKLQESSSAHQDPSNSRAALWTIRKTFHSTEPLGLFAANAHRSTYRTTTAIPIACPAIRQARTSTAPLSLLTSDALWSPSNFQAFSRDWISESSIRAPSPSLYSASNSSSARSSPITASYDGESIRSASTKASSLWRGLQNVIEIPAWWDSKNGKDKVQAGEAQLPSPDFKQYLLSNPVRTKSVKRTLPPSRESRVLASRDLWEAKGAASAKDTASRPNWMSPRSNPTIKQETKITKGIAKNAATVAQWQMALEEAVSCGTPKLQRPVTSAQDWKRALAQAIPKVQRPSATAEDWKAALDQARPAIKNQVAQYDSAIRHPVFFTSAMNTTVEMVHPAAFSYVKSSTMKAPITKNLWSSPAKTYPELFTGAKTWSMSQQPTPRTVIHHTPPVLSRKIASSKSTALPTLASNTLFTITVDGMPATTKNWLHATAVLKVSAEADISIIVQLAETTNNDIFFTPSDLRASLANNQISTEAKKPSPISVLLTNSFSQENEDKSVASKEEFGNNSYLTVPSRASTWTKPSSVASSRNLILSNVSDSPRASQLWLPSTTYTRASRVAPTSQPAFVSSTQQEPWKRSSRRRITDSELENFAEKGMWRYGLHEADVGEKQVEKNWIVERKASKVDFRY